MRTQYCGLVSAAYLDQIVTLCGWVHRRRDHGGVIFIDLRDREGLVQVVCDPDRADMFQVAELVRNEFVLKITGKVRLRPEGARNANMASGAIEVLGYELEVLNQRLVGERHLSLKLRHRGEPVDGIWFGRTEPLPARALLAWRLDVNEWRGERKVQFVVEGAQE